MVTTLCAGDLPEQVSASITKGSCCSAPRAALGTAQQRAEGGREEAARCPDQWVGLIAQYCCYELPVKYLAGLA